MPTEEPEIRTVQQSLDLIASTGESIVHDLGRILEQLKDLTAAVEALNQPFAIDTKDLERILAAIRGWKDPKDASRHIDAL